MRTAGGAKAVPSLRAFTTSTGAIDRHPDSQTVFFTDRAIYRPGQSIYYKGVSIRHDQDAVSVRVRPADKAKVLDLTQALAKLRRDPERGRLGLLRGESEIGSAYEVEYRNAYRDAYARYEEAFFKCWNGSPGLSADQVRQVVLDARK